MKIALIVVALILFGSVESVVLSKVIRPVESAHQRKSILRDFLNSAVAGAISCSITHSLVCPLDVVKTKIQTDVALKGKSTMDAFRIIVKSSGKGILLQGLAATFSGYAMQGFCKFGFYELIKSKVYKFVDDKDVIQKFRLPILIASSGLAEVIASWALCPMEATRIYMVMNPQLMSGMFDTMKVMMQTGGPSVLFRGLPMIMLRQVPYTCAKLAGYEIISDTLKKTIGGIRRRNASQYDVKIDEVIDNPSWKSVRKNDILIQLTSGILAGVLAAVISQPADVLLSMVCGGSDPSVGCTIINGPITLLQVIREVGLRGCYVGLQPRAIMVGSLTAMQFIIYEQTKARIQKITMPDKFLEMKINKMSS